MRKYIFYFIFFFVFSFSSCNDCAFLGEKALGNRFSLVEADKDDISIIYCTSKKCCDVGIPIVPSKVEDYNYNSKWIIAKSRSVNKTTYWVIDKDFIVEFKYDSGMRKEILSHVLGPLDSIMFKQELINKNIDLKFSKN